MQRILSVSQMRYVDEYTIQNLGISQDELVVRAGTAVANQIKNKFLGGRVLVCVGKGNNGKDGLVVADILKKTHGYNVTVFDAQNDNIEVFDKIYDIIVDCIFGTGLNKVVEDKYKIIIQKINASKAFIISCDIPSGINGDNGCVMGIAVKANFTVAIQEYKLGHFLGDGIDYCGELTCVDIGISVWDENFVKRIDDRDAKLLFKHRDRNVHKGCFGKTCILGGSPCYSGSVVLSTNALFSLKSGVGYAYLAIPKSLFSAYVGKIPECILIPIQDDNNSMILDKYQLDKLMRCDSIAVGMGMTNTEGVYDIIKYLLENYCGNLIIDADGLNALSTYGTQILKNKKCKVILTPHLGEFSRLASIGKQEVVTDSIKYAVEFAKEYQVIVVLKSAVSIITDGNQVYINTTGCSGMAKAGSGDVLSGFMAGLTARTNDLLEGAVIASYVFGLAGEYAQKNGCEFTVTASEIIEQLPKVIQSL